MLLIGLICTPCAMMNTAFVSSKIHEYIELCAPLKTVTIGHRYVIREKWTTKALLKNHPVRVIPCQINQFFAKFARPPPISMKFGTLADIKSVQIFSDVGQAVSEI